MGNRKRKAYAVKEKLYFVQRVNDGESQASISREIGVPKSTICGWIKDEERLKKFAIETHDDKESTWRKRTKTAYDTLLDTLLFEWFTQERLNGSVLNGKIIKLQALKLSKGINGPDDTFLASEGWLWRFLKRHGIKSFNLSTETEGHDLGTTDHDTADASRIKLQEVLESENYVDDQVYSANETGLNYKLLPIKTDDDSVQFSEHRMKKDRLTVLLTCNKTGTHKLKPFMLGKSKNPRSLHHINRSTLPVRYRYSKKSWMTTYLFEEWFFQYFVPEVRDFLKTSHLEEKAILLLNNCPAHCPVASLRTQDGKIRAYLLPENTTYLVQPLDQGVIQAAKAHYRRNLVNSLIESDMQPIPFLKTVTIKDVMFWLAKAWKTVAEGTIEACWTKGVGLAFGNAPFEEIVLQDITDAVEKFKKYAGELSIDTDLGSVSRWSTCDDDLPVADHRTEQEMLTDSLEHSSSDDDDDDIQTGPQSTDDDRKPQLTDDNETAPPPTDEDRKPLLAGNDIITLPRTYSNVTVPPLPDNNTTDPPSTEGPTDVAEAIRCLNYTIRHMETSPGNFFEPMSLVLIKMVLANLKLQQGSMDQ